MRRMYLAVVFSILFLVIAVGLSCAAESELMVSAAASLTDAFTDIGKAYEKQHPGTVVKFNFASSGALATQIEQGAPVDVFVSADAETTERLRKKSLVVASTEAVVASNTLVVAVPADSKIKIRGLADLKSDEIGHIGIGDPSHVPAGKYARQTLEKLHLWNALEHKLVMGSDVRQVRTYIQRGEVEVGFIFGTDARAKDVRVAYVVPVSMYGPIEIRRSRCKAKQQSQLCESVSCSCKIQGRTTHIGKIRFLACSEVNR